MKVKWSISSYLSLFLYAGNRAFIAISADSAKEAKEMYVDKLGKAGGENFHAVDTTGDAYLVEHTASKDFIRQSGDFGEKDYLIATNGYLGKKMESSLYTGDEVWDDDLPRYWTEEKVMQDAAGSATVDTINDALGCTSYYVEQKYLDLLDEGKICGYMPVENGVMVDDNWDIVDYTGFWTPENREAGTKCAIRAISDPENLTMYVMHP